MGSFDFFLGFKRPEIYFTRAKKDVLGLGAVV
jgi:hypothetical protein